MRRSFFGRAGRKAPRCCSGKTGTSSDMAAAPSEAAEEGSTLQPSDGGMSGLS